MTATTGNDGAHAARVLRDLLSIPSESGRERRASVYLAEQMSRLGLRSWVDEVGNAHGVAGSPDDPTVMLLGHIDTVPGHRPVCQVGDLLFGRGAVDAKGSIVAMVCAAARVRDARVHVVAAVGEEASGSVGAHHVLATVDRPDAVIIGEPSGWDGVCVGYKGRVGITYVIERPPQHTSSPEPTAVDHAVAFACLVEELLTSMSKTSDPVAFCNPQSTLVNLTGDLARGEAFITCRVPPGFDFDAFEKRLRAFPHTRIEFDERVAAVRRPRSDLVANQLRAGITANGGTATLKVKAGTSDMNTVEPWGVPMAAYGPGDAHLDHTDDEHLPLADLTRAIDVLTTAVTGIGRRLAGPDDGEPAVLTPGHEPAPAGRG